VNIRWGKGYSPNDSTSLGQRNESILCTKEATSSARTRASSLQISAFLVTPNSQNGVSCICKGNAVQVMNCVYFSNFSKTQPKYSKDPSSPPSVSTVTFQMPSLCKSGRMKCGCRNVT
jgi:hypothetical protein